MEALTPRASGSRRLKWHALWRRSLFFGLTFLSAIAAVLLMFHIVRANGLSWLEWLGLPLFFGLFIWIAGAFWTAIAGFVIQLIGRDKVIIHSDEVAGKPLQRRTALVMPIYNEEPTRVGLGLDIIWSSMLAHPEQAAFDLFILSDTRKPEIGAAEEKMWRALVRKHNAAGRIFYRRREQNTGRKAGNIADFVRSWGAAYDHMVVLDADSIMTAKALVAMAALMEAHQEVGIVQTLPTPVGRDSLFARLVQFAARLNGPMLSSGLTFWQMGEANYWGHNAIIRIRPFAEFCALPHLPGAAPLGGEILSHDFVEAAFMRRAGYKVWMVPDIEGSWEEVPSNIIDFAARDRRWAQGNLQHFNVIPMRGLHWLSRLHMITGILSYATSPIWLVVLILSSIITCIEALGTHQYFEPGMHTLFPHWPEARAGEIAALLGVTILVLLLPKVLGATLALTNKSLRRGFGGTRGIVLSVLAEQLFSMLLAPSMMIFHSTFVITTLLGKPVVWNAQERGDRGLTFPEALERQKWHVTLGFAWGAIIAIIAPSFLGWLAPVLIGLVLSPWLTMWTSHVSLGVKFRKWGLLLTPEETSPAPELAALRDPAALEILHDEIPPLEESQPARAPVRMEAEAAKYYEVRHMLNSLRRYAPTDA